MGPRHEYVPLNRRFTQVEGEPSNWIARQIHEENFGESWDQIAPANSSHERSVVVVLGPSGSGKSTELRERASVMRNAGIPAFLLSAKGIAHSGVAEAIDDPGALKEWMNAATRAVFFIDAIDEARLVGHDLDQVLARFNRDVDPVTKSLLLVLSSRNDVWSDDDKRHITQRLVLPETDPPIRVVRLEPLARGDLRRLAKAGGVDDVDAFIAAIAQDELEQVFVDIRPPDAELLVEYWRRYGRFGTWSEMIEASIDANTRNENRNYAQAQQFTTEEARSGLARLAAATVLGKRSQISLPGVHREGHVSADSLFVDRRQLFVTQVLQLGLCVQKGTDSVQLPQGPPTAYLASVWLAERVRRGWDPKELESHFLIDPFQHGEPRLPESRSAVAGWLASLVPEFRRRILPLTPEVVLFGGDPARLTRGECVVALRAVLSQTRVSGVLPSRSGGVVRQIARHEIGDVVACLLVEFGDCPNAQHLLLGIARSGRYEEVVPIALELALDSERIDEIRTAAIRVVGAAGRECDRERLLPLVSSPSEWIKLALVQVLVPTMLHGTALVDLVMSTTKWDVAFLMGRELDSAALSDVDAIIVKLTEILGSGKIGEASEAYFKLLPKLVVCRLKRDKLAFASWMLDALLTIESLMSGPMFLPGDVREELNNQLATRTDLRRALWVARISRSNNEAKSHLLFSSKISGVHAGDILWLYGQRQAAQAEGVKNVLGMVLASALQGLPPEERSALLERNPSNAELAEFVLHLEFEESRGLEIQTQHEEQELAEKAELRTKNVRALLPRRESIEAGADLDALNWAWTHLTGEEHKYGRLGTGRLREGVGDDLAAAFAKGFRQCWRKNTVELPVPGSNSTPVSYLAGLTGVALEVEGGLKFADLSEQEAESACRHALFELNGLPWWFDSLRAAHPSIVAQLLAKAVHREWTADVESHGLVLFASREPIGTADSLRGLIWDELECGAPVHPTTLHNAIDALILGSQSSRERVELLRHYLVSEEQSVAPWGAEWLRAWSHFAAKEAGKWLQALAKSNRTRFVEIAQEVAERLEVDFEDRSRAGVRLTWEPRALELWVRVMHQAARPEDDIDRWNKGGYSPGKRDRAQRFRERLLAQLARDPCQGAYEALHRLQCAKDMAHYRDSIARCIDVQLGVAAEQIASAWTEKDIVAVERGDERVPKSTSDLFGLVKRHLSQVARLVENDSFSYAALFGEDEPEKHVQCWVASSLKLVSRGLYVVEREPEVQDDKLIDISVSVPGVGRLPIEIKPITKKRYSLLELRRCISQQLVGRYMRPPEVDRGILLLVSLVKRGWSEGRRRRTIEQGLAELRKYAQTIDKREFKEVAIVHIDVASARPEKPPRTVSGRAKSRSKRAVAKGNARKLRK